MKHSRVHPDAWIQTVTGRQFWPLEPDPADVDITDIAHALSHQCRFNGHTTRFYSVAQHSVLVSQLVPPADALWGLMHDAAEVYLPDVARPIKRQLVGFDEIEDRVMAAIAERFDLPMPMPESIRHADLVALHTERIHVMAPPPVQWSTDVLAGPDDDPIEPWEPTTAHFKFRQRFLELTFARRKAALKARTGAAT